MTSEKRAFLDIKAEMSSTAVRYGTVAALGGLVGYAAYRYSTATPRKLTRNEAMAHSDARVRLAQCLSDKGYKLYGTTWCGWCKKQLDVCGATSLPI